MQWQKFDENNQPTNEGDYAVVDEENNMWLLCIYNSNYKLSDQYARTIGDGKIRYYLYIERPNNVKREG